MKQQHVLVLLIKAFRVFLPAGFIAIIAVLLLAHYQHCWQRRRQNWLHIQIIIVITTLYIKTP